MPSDQSCGNSSHSRLISPMSAVPAADPRCSLCFYFNRLCIYLCGETHCSSAPCQQRVLIGTCMHIRRYAGCSTRSYVLCVSCALLSRTIAWTCVMEVAIACPNSFTGFLTQVHFFPVVVPLDRVLPIFIACFRTQ